MRMVRLGLVALLLAAGVGVAAPADASPAPARPAEACAPIGLVHPDPGLGGMLQEVYFAVTPIGVPLGLLPLSLSFGSIPDGCAGREGAADPEFFGFGSMDCAQGTAIGYLYVYWSTNLLTAVAGISNALSIAPFTMTMRNGVLNFAGTMSDEGYLGGHRFTASLVVPPSSTCAQIEQLLQDGLPFAGTLVVD